MANGLYTLHATIGWGEERTLLGSVQQGGDLAGLGRRMLLLSVSDPVRVRTFIRSAHTTNHAPWMTVTDPMQILEPDLQRTWSVDLAPMAADWDYTYHLDMDDRLLTIGGDQPPYEIVLNADLLESRARAESGVLVRLIQGLDVLYDCLDSIAN